MNHQDEPFHPEAVDEQIEWLIKREKPGQGLPRTPGAIYPPDPTSARLVTDLRNMTHHDARRLARIKERLALHAATTFQGNQQADPAPLTPRTQEVSGAQETPIHR